MGQPNEIAGSRAGKIMMVIAWLLGMWLAMQYFATWENPNQNPQSTYADRYVEVVLKSGIGGHYVASGYINGQAVAFMVDTGATHVTVSSGLAGQLGLQKGAPIDMSTANGVSRGWVTLLKSVRLGDIELTNVRAVIASNMDDEVLLGMSFLRSLEFSQRNGQLILRQYKSND